MTTLTSTFITSTMIAHEFGHILQYKAGYTWDGSWQMEPHADFMRCTISTEYDLERVDALRCSIPMTVPAPASGATVRSKSTARGGRAGSRRAQSY